MKTVGLYNLKGGVGKTATAVNLAYLAALDGKRTLIWDLDPQGAASFYFRIEPKLSGGRKALLKQKRHPIEDQIRGTDFPRLDLIPADFSLRTLDVALDGKKRPTRQLARLLEPLADEYDLVFFDCPPSLSRVSESVFEAAQVLMVPIIPTTLSIRTLEQLAEHLRENGPENLPVWPFFCMVDLRKKLHREVMAQAEDGNRDFAGIQHLETSIPYASDVERMGVERQPIANFAGAGKAARAYLSLWSEVRRRLRGQGNHS